MLGLVRRRGSGTGISMTHRIRSKAAPINRDRQLKRSVSAARFALIWAHRTQLAESRLWGGTRQTGGSSDGQGGQLRRPRSKAE